MRLIMLFVAMMSVCISAFSETPAVIPPTNIIGTWKTQLSDESGRTMERTLSFTIDDILHVATKDANGQVISQTNYTYKLTNESLVLNQGDQSLTITIKWVDPDHFQFSFDKQVWNYNREHTKDIAPETKANEQEATPVPVPVQIPAEHENTSVPVQHENTPIQTPTEHENTSVPVQIPAEYEKTPVQTPVEHEINPVPAQVPAEHENTSIPTQVPVEHENAPVPTHAEHETTTPALEPATN